MHIKKFFQYSFLLAAIQKVKLQVDLYVDVTEAKEVLEGIRLVAWDFKNFKICNIEFSNFFDRYN